MCVCVRILETTVGWSVGRRWLATFLFTFAFIFGVLSALANAIVMTGSAFLRMGTKCVCTGFSARIISRKFCARARYH